MKKKKQLLGILLTLVLMLGLMVGMSVTAYADDDPPYAQYKNTTNVITFDSKSWYLIDYDASTVTLLAKECVGASKYNENGNFVEYSSNPTVKTAVDDWYNKNITADAQKAVSGNAMFLLTTFEANAITNAEVRKDGTAADGWWLCSQGIYDHCAAFVVGGSGDVHVYGRLVDQEIGVRPALKLNLSSVIFSSESNTFSLKPHEHDGITFEPWTKTDSLPDTSDLKDGEGSFYLTEDVTLSNTWTVPEGTTSLCLNGHGIKFNGTNICVIIIWNNRTLNLYDCDTSTKHSFTVSDGLATIDDTFNENNQTFTGGYITGGNNTGNGGGVGVLGTFNMYGGTIIGNNGNHGGGVDVAIFASFNMTGGSIMYNTASGSGGGVNTVDTVNINGGSIENNTAGVDGGGVNIGMNGKLNMTGGLITENTANGSEGGGVWVSSGGQFTVSGAPKITRNTTKNATKNVFLPSTSKITVNGSLKGEDDSKANIGVTMKSSDVFTSGWSTKMESTSNPADYFFSDNSDYGVTLTTGEKPEAQLLRCYPLKYDSNGGSGSMTSQSVYDGDTFTFPECTFTPPRNKTLDHWKMSGVDGIFQPSQQVTITSNCVQGGAITVTAYWKDCAPYQQTERDIQDLPPLSSITLDNKDDVLKAMDEYNNLSSEDQKKIAPELVDKLMKAYDKIQVLIVEDIAGKLPSEITLNDEDAVNAAVEAYLALTEAQKELFSPELRQRLADAEDVINKGKAAAITTKVSGAKNLKGGKVRMQLGKPHYNAVKGKAASGKSVLSAQEVTAISGFYVQYSTDKKFKKKVKTKKIKNPKAKTVTIKHLKKGKTYYFRTCTYTEVKNRVSGEEKTVKGKWSTKKKVKINK